MILIAYSVKDELVDFGQPFFIQETKHTDDLAMRYLKQFLNSGKVDRAALMDQYLYRVGFYDTDNGYLGSENPPECICKAASLIGISDIEVVDGKYEDEVCETF